MRHWIIIGMLGLAGASEATPPYGADRGYAIFPARACTTHYPSAWSYRRTVHVYHAPPRYAGGPYASYPYYCPPPAYGRHEHVGYGHGYRAPSYAAPRYRRPTGVYTVYGSGDYDAVPKSYESVTGESMADRREAEGWTLLAEGDARAAIRSFTRAATEARDEAAPKVGYAVSAAELGDETTAVWAMRRAFRIDPVGARHLPLEAELSVLLERQRRFFEYDSRLDPPDAWFMVAALHAVAHEDEAALEAARRAREAGDRSHERRRLEAELSRDERRAGG